jgi:hypothetical protein
VTHQQLEDLKGNSKGEWYSYLGYKAYSSVPGGFCV